MSLGSLTSQVYVNLEKPRFDPTKHLMEDAEVPTLSTPKETETGEDEDLLKPPAA